MSSPTISSNNLVEATAYHARLLLREACTPDGLVASTVPTDNYRRIWARDAVVAGIAGLTCGEEIVIEGLAASLRTLAAHQGPQGQIPSNVAPETGQVSFGGLAGRVDACGWFVVGAARLTEYRGHSAETDALLPAVEKALAVYDAWEFNGRGLVYVPVSGNWADEYVTHGYQLYDQLLRLWALECASKTWNKPAWAEKAVQLRALIQANYWPATGKEDAPRYHKTAYATAAQQDHFYWACSFSPTGYDTRFDLMANALALHLGLCSPAQLQAMQLYADALMHKIGSALLPAFWPVIYPTDAEWPALAANYAYRFKNEPHHFHNGGIWPVWLGWFGAGLAANGDRERPAAMLQALCQALATDTVPFSFCEYLSSDTLTPGGTRRLCYTASGVVMLDAAIS